MLRDTADVLYAIKNFYKIHYFPFWKVLDTNQLNQKRTSCYFNMLLLIFGSTFSEKMGT